VCAAPRSALSADGHEGRCEHSAHLWFCGFRPVAGAAASGGSIVARVERTTAALVRYAEHLDGARDDLALA
jgi:hypothetical protein